VLALFATSVGAQTATATAVAGPAAPASATASARALAHGKVIEVDRKEKRVLLEHGPIQHIGMDAMTMEFSVPDGRLLASLRRGDRVRFDVVYRNGDYEITRLEVVGRRGSKPKAGTKG
jgi:Cu/Ag efflux protein CusF